MHGHTAGDELLVAELLVAELLAVLDDDELGMFYTPQKVLHSAQSVRVLADNSGIQLVPQAALIGNAPHQ